MRNRMSKPIPKHTMRAVPGGWIVSTPDGQSKVLNYEEAAKLLDSFAKKATA